MGVKWTGLSEYEQELDALPQAANGQAAGILATGSEATAAELRATYPVRTGELQASVQVRTEERDRTTTQVIENTSDHAIVFEYGRGGRPGGKVFWPIVGRRIREARAALGGMLVNDFGAVRVTDRDA